MKIRDLLDQTDTIINSYESFSYVSEDLIWNGDTARFSVGAEMFGATLTPSSPEDNATYAYFFDPIPKVGNVDFWMETDDEKTQDSTGLMKSSALKVLASVALVVAELRKRHDYDILLCAAKRTHSPTNFENRKKRLRDYSRKIDL